MCDDIGVGRDMGMPSPERLSARGERWQPLRHLVGDPSSIRPLPDVAGRDELDSPGSVRGVK